MTFTSCNFCSVLNIKICVIFFFYCSQCVLKHVWKWPFNAFALDTATGGKWKLFLIIQLLSTIRTHNNILIVFMVYFTSLKRNPLQKSVNFFSLRCMTLCPVIACSDRACTRIDFELLRMIQP